MLTSSNTSSRIRWGALPLRLMIGFGFAAHGYAKLSKGPEKFADILQTLHVPAPLLSAWTTMVVELVGGLMLMAGAFVAVVSIPLAIVMLTAILTVHWRYGFSSIKLMGVTESGAQFGPPGYELNLLYIAGLIALALGGPGPLSLDGFLAHRKKRDPP